MRFSTSCLLSAIALAVACNAIAATAEKGLVSRVYNDTVAPADQVAYEAGVKAYNKCLGEHGVKQAWTAWNHETGNTYLYSFVSGPHTWATFDAMHETSKPCDDAWRTQANPHLKSEVSAFLVVLPEASHMAKEEPKPALMTVTFFKLKHGREANDAFMDGIKKINAAAEKTNWSNHYVFQRVRAGDTVFPDYILVSQSKDWADFGTDANPTLWKMVEGVYGKADTDALRKSINDAIEDISTHVNSYNADLTYSGK